MSYIKRKRSDTLYCLVSLTVSMSFFSRLGPSAVPCTVVLPPDEDEDGEYVGGSASYDQLDFAPRPSRELKPHYHSASTLRSRHGSRSPKEEDEPAFKRSETARRSAGQLSDTDMPKVNASMRLCSIFNVRCPLRWGSFPRRFCAASAIFSATLAITATTLRAALSSPCQGRSRRTLRQQQRGPLQCLGSPTAAFLVPAARVPCPGATTRWACRPCTEWRPRKPDKRSTSCDSTIEE